jgi:15-cis-phytoene synthase
VSDAGYVANFLRDADRDRYYATLMLKPSERDAVQAIYAFSADVASIRDRARETAAGEIRLQWWIDGLNGDGHGNVRGNPIAAALLDAVEAYRLPVAPLTRLVEARRFDLYNDPMPDVASFEGYAGETNSVLHQLAALVVDRGTAAEASDAAGHFGVAQAVAGHIRAFGHNAARGRLFLPLSVFAANGVSMDDILSGRVSDGLVSARDQLVDMALDHADAARRSAKALPATMRPIFAGLALIRPELSAVQSNRDSLFSAPQELADWHRLTRLAWAAWRGP